MSRTAAATAAKTGKPRTPGSGRAAGTRNKATEARERDALERLRAGPAANLPRAKDELLALIPRIKNVVGAFFNAAMVDQEGTGSPAMMDEAGGFTEGPNFDPAKWARFKEWALFFSRVCSDAADFQDPRYRAIAVAMQQPGDTKPEPITIDDDGKALDTEARERRANASYLTLVKG